MKFLANSIFSIFFISLFSITSVVYAQSEPIENPSINVTDVAIENKVYGPSDEISGTFVLNNPTSFDISDIYFVVSLVGSEDDSIPKFRNTYDFNNPSGPYFVATGESQLVDFSFTMPPYKPATHLGVRFDVFLQSGERLGNSEIHLDTSGEIMPQLNISNPRIRVGDASFKISQRTVIYKNEEAFFSYTVENPHDFDLKVEPQITIRKEGEVDEVLAKYKEQQVQIESLGSIGLRNVIRNFDNTPGFYVARVDLVDENNVNRAAPLIFRYVVDGDTASIKSIFTDAGYKLRSGEDFNVTINYEGKPYDFRDVERTRLVRGASIFVEVTDLEGNSVVKKSFQTDLEPKGTIDVPLTAESSAKGLKINVRISKEGQLLSENSIEIPEREEKGSFPMYLYPIIILLIIIVIISAIFKNLKDKGMLVALVATFMMFGFANSAYAITQDFTTVYTVGDPAYIPTNISIDATGQEYFYSDSSVTVYYDSPEPASFNSEVRSAYSMWSGADCRYYGGGCNYTTDLWIESPPVSVLTAGSCSDGNNCDISNYTYWQGGTTLEPGQYCDYNGCQYINTSTYYAPDEEGGTYRLYLYIRSEYEVEDCSGGSCVYDTVVGAALVYTDITFTDLTPDEAYCTAYVTSSGVSTEGADIPTGTEITWYVNTENNEIGDPNPSACQGECINGQELYDPDPIILKWRGDVGDTASSTISDPSSDLIPQDLIEWYDNSTLYCQNYAEENVLSTCSNCDGWQADYENGRCTQTGTAPDYVCEIIYYCDEYDYCEEYEECNLVDDGIATFDVWNVPGATEVYGTSFTTTYSTSTLPASSTLAVYLDYKEQAVSTWNTLSCVLNDVGVDLCPNLTGIQATVPVGYDVYPNPDDVGTNGITYGDLNCFPVSLARAGTVTLDSDPSTIDINESVNWTFSLSADFFGAILDGITYVIPRFANVSWSGDISNSAFESGNPATTTTIGVEFSDPLLTNVDNDLSVTYATSGGPSVSITIDDPYLEITDTAFATVNAPFCETECDPCPTEEICDNGNPTDNPEVSNFNLDPVIANEENVCTLTWQTNNYTESCVLTSTSAPDTNVATSSPGYDVGPGTYTLVCLNYAPEQIIGGPLTCLQNPDLRED